MAIYLLLGLLTLLACMAAWRQIDAYRDHLAVDRLTALAQGDEARFAPSMVADLPEPARRYFSFMIKAGAPLRRAVRIEMEGALGLGTKADPKYRAMTASQILAPPYGLVWSVKTGMLSGSDGAVPEGSWTRFWLAGLVPVVRASSADHHRSAFGRVIAEAAFWAPASLLPRDGVTWAGLDDTTARAIVRQGKFTQSVDITVDAAGAPTEVLIQRWSNENPEKVFREQPFGGYPSLYREVDGYRLPTRVEGGNHFGTAEFFPFFKANVTDIVLV